jgi:hypothetical protein
VAVKQSQWFCHACDINMDMPMCETCFKTCHKDCAMINNPDNGKDQREFICFCGRKKHILENKTKETGNIDKKCYLIELDYKLRIYNSYKCDVCKVQNLCSICAKKCHSQCMKRVTMKNLLASMVTSTIELEEDDGREEKEDEVYDAFKLPYPSNKHICECNSDNHSNINKQIHLIEKFAFIENFSYESIRYIWPIQVFNCFIESDNICKLYFSGIEKLIKSFDKSNDLENIQSNALNTLIILSSNVSKSVIYYYYNKKLTDMLNFKNLQKFVIRFSKLFKENYNEVGFLINLLY